MVETLVFNVIQDGGPILYHNDSEQQRSFESTCSKFRRFLQGEKRTAITKRRWKLRRQRISLPRGDSPPAWKAQTPRFPHYPPRGYGFSPLSGTKQNRAVELRAISLTHPQIPHTKRKDKVAYDKSRYLVTLARRGSPLSTITAATVGKAL